MTPAAGVLGEGCRGEGEGEDEEGVRGLRLRSQHPAGAPPQDVHQVPLLCYNSMSVKCNVCAIEEVNDDISPGVNKNISPRPIQ
jgi:hypothetical protein